MFTGLVRELGVVAGDPVASGEGGVRLTLAHSDALGERLSVGASLAVAGVCLTVVTLDGGRSTFKLSPETLARTTLDSLRDGRRVNLEPALAAGEALGGHWVQGHVDGTLAVVGRRDLGEHRVLAFELPPAFRPWVVEKGSLTIDGVSLTVSALREDACEVALIPHTLAMTTLAELVVGDRVNFEADVLGKYVLRAFELYRPGGGT